MRMEKCTSKFQDSSKNSGAPKKSGDVLELHGETVPNPFSALEKPDLPSTQAFIRAQNARFFETIKDTGNHDESRAFLEDALNAPAKGIPARAGESYLFYYKGEKDKTHNLMISDTPDGDGRLLIDPVKETGNAAAELGGVYPSPDGRHVAYRICEGGEWDGRLRVLDLETGAHLPETLRTGTIWWDKDGRGFHYNGFAGDGSGRLAVKHHALGEDVAKDKVFYDDPAAPQNAAGFSCCPYMGHWNYQGTREFLFISDHSMQAEVHLKDENGGYRQIFDGRDGHFLPVSDTEGGVLFYTTSGAPHGKIVLADPENPDPRGWKTIVPEDAENALQHAFMQGGKIFALYNDDGADRLKIFDKNGNAESEVPLPDRVRVMFGHSMKPGTSIGTAGGDGDNLYLSATGFTQGQTVLQYNIKSGRTTLLDPDMGGAALKDCVVERIYATSKDGTQVPMTVVRGKDTQLDGTAALKLTAYGAHGAVSGPVFNAEDADFVRSGGIFVQANIRGGGEFGQGWHEQGRGHNKQNSFDDFIACAEHLSAQNYTAPQRLVAEGHSSGGLLVLASMLQKPEAFGAVIAGAPVADMVRENPPWHAEYGDPFKNKEDFKTVKAYCPRLNIKTGERYPPCLVRTGAKDERLAADAYKFIATIQDKAPDSPAFLRVEEEYGHGTARSKDATLSEALSKKSFIEQAVGPIDPRDCKQQPALSRGREVSSQTKYGQGQKRP